MQRMHCQPLLQRPKVEFPFNRQFGNNDFLGSRQETTSKRRNEREESSGKFIMQFA